VGKPASKKPSTGGEAEEALSSDPLEDLLRIPWEIECNGCKKSFTHSFTDVEIKSLEEPTWTVHTVKIACLAICQEYPPTLTEFSFACRICSELTFVSLRVLGQRALRIWQK